MPRLLELFSGTKSISKVAKTLGWQTVSLDLDSKHKPDLCMDILDFDETQYPNDYFQFIWASPDCRAYSIARQNTKIPREEAMQASDPLLKKTRQIIAYFDKAKWCIENPGFSYIWQREVAAGLLENSVITSYCSFEGYAYRKHTRLDSNFPLVLPKCPGKGLCPKMIGGKHKEHAQRGGGGQEPKSHNLDKLHSIPEGLVHEIFKQLNVGSDASTD